VIELAESLANSSTCFMNPPLSASRSAASSMVESTALMVGIESVVSRPVVLVVAAAERLVSFSSARAGRLAMETAERLSTAATSAALEILSTMTIPS
jgi:hypothetical protein